MMLFRIFFDMTEPIKNNWRQINKIYFYLYNLSALILDISKTSKMRIGLCKNEKISMKIIAIKNVWRDIS